MRTQVIEALQRVGMPAEMSRRPAGGYSGGCGSYISGPVSWPYLPLPEAACTTVYCDHSVTRAQPISPPYI